MSPIAGYGGHLLLLTHNYTSLGGLTRELGNKLNNHSMGKEKSLATFYLAVS